MTRITFTVLRQIRQKATLVLPFYVHFTFPIFHSSQVHVCLGALRARAARALLLLHLLEVNTRSPPTPTLLMAFQVGLLRCCSEAEGLFEIERKK